MLDDLTNLFELKRLQRRVIPLTKALVRPIQLKVMLGLVQLQGEDFIGGRLPVRHATGGILNQ